MPRTVAVRGRPTRRPSFAVIACALVLAACRGAPRPAPWPERTSLPDSLGAILARARADSVFPGGIAVIGTRDAVLATVPVGTLDWAPSAAVSDSTLWDLASLTKLVALTSTMATLVQEGRLDLDAPVRRFVPEWQVPLTEAVTVRDLLLHRAGLPAFKLFYKQANGRDAIRALVLATPLDTMPRARMVYSDLGAIILGIVVERITGQPFDLAVRERVFGPLGMDGAQYNPPAALQPRIAPTERDPWRGRLVHGEVHDENAFAMGGISSHAGVFASARDLVRFAQGWLGAQPAAGPWLADSTRRLFTTVADSAFSSRALGWDTPTGTNSAGTRLTTPAFGHTGFTGTSLWIDPSRDLFVLLLTNRVNPTRERAGIAAVRIAVADAAVAWRDRMRARAAESAR
ncbi:MAG: beta-lactamase family protein [Gemmatimonadetes bacterium]|nr:beta-lactamase family protein [Gemmatimonadota bacterium]